MKKITVIALTSVLLFGCSTDSGVGRFVQSGQKFILLDSKVGTYCFANGLHADFKSRLENEYGRYMKIESCEK